MTKLPVLRLHGRKGIAFSPWEMRPEKGKPTTALLTTSASYAFTRT